MTVASIRPDTLVLKPVDHLRRLGHRVVMAREDIVYGREAVDKQEEFIVLAELHEHWSYMEPALEEQRGF